MERAWKERIAPLQQTISDYEAGIQALKSERKQRSATLQQKLFEQFKMLNYRGEVKTLCDIFRQTVHKPPPAGAGECAAPKLLQQAYLHGWKPIAMAEFWWGDSPKAEIRHHGYYYPACKGKCGPILGHMLQGLEVDENPLLSNTHKDTELEIVFEDEWLVVVNKPSGMLSVPGKEEDMDSVYHRLKEKYPDATGPMIVHRLDMATSGLLLVAKTKEVHQHLQAQFENRSIKKSIYRLTGRVHNRNRRNNKSNNRKHKKNRKGKSNRSNKYNRKGRKNRTPSSVRTLSTDRAKSVDEEHGKEAITEYQIITNSEKHTRIAFCPLTGRTHQLRVHAAHPKGLNCPILGDELYGKKADRLYLHAEYIEFRHPIYGDIICIQKEPDF